MSSKKDTYFIKKQKKQKQPREIASLVFPKPKKTIIEPIKLSILPADRMDDYTLTPYDIDPVDGLPTAEYLQENPDLISMTSGPARGMLQAKLKKAKELQRQSQEALVDLPNILEDNKKKQDRQRGIIALLNVMDGLPARIRANLIQNINQAQAGPASPIPGAAGTASPVALPPSPPPMGPTGTEYQEFKASYDALTSRNDAQSKEEKRIILDNLRELLNVKGQRKSEAQVLKMLEDADVSVLQRKFRAKSGAKNANYNIVMKPYNVYA